LTNEAPSDTASALDVVVNIPPASNSATRAGAAGEKLCIVLVTYDAKYEARYSYRLPPTPGWYRLRFPTERFADTLRRLGPAHISPLAFISRDCARRMETDVHLAALFGTAIASPRMQLKLLATGANAVRVIVPVDGQVSTCVGPHEFAYNYRCVVDMSALRGHTVEFLVRRRDKLNVTTERMKVWGGQ